VSGVSKEIREIVNIKTENILSIEDNETRPVKSLYGQQDTMLTTGDVRNYVIHSELFHPELLPSYTDRVNKSRETLFLTKLKNPTLTHATQRCTVYTVFKMVRTAIKRNFFFYPKITIE
jgi:hypothetical protein